MLSRVGRKGGSDCRGQRRMQGGIPPCCRQNPQHGDSAFEAVAGRSPPVHRVQVPGQGGERSGTGDRVVPPLGADDVAVKEGGVTGGNAGRSQSGSHHGCCSTGIGRTACCRQRGREGGEQQPALIG